MTSTTAPCRPPTPSTLLSETVARLIDAGARSCCRAATTTPRAGSGSPATCWRGPVCTSAPRPRRSACPVVVAGVAVHALPYLEPSAAAETLGPPSATHAGVLRAAMARVEADLATRGAPRWSWPTPSSPAGPPATASATSASAGSSAVPRRLRRRAYAALGHLHGRQQLSERVRYSGSPLAMSFSEAGTPRVPGWSTSPRRGSSVEAVEAPVERPLACCAATSTTCWPTPPSPRPSGLVPGDPHRPGAPAGAMDRLRPRFPHALVLRWEPQGARGAGRAATPRGSTAATTSTSAATSSPTSAAVTAPTAGGAGGAARGARGLAGRAGRRTTTRGASSPLSMPSRRGRRVRLHRCG